MGRGDPKVSGVLPVAFERASKIIGYLMLSSKEYIAVMQLHRRVEESRLREVVTLFTGKIYQKPPLRSSVKRALRTKEIYELEIIEIDYPYVLLRISCEHGTYVRKLIHDMGLILGVGAHMRELRRIRTGPFKEDETLVTMHRLSEALYLWRELKDDAELNKIILPAEYGVSHMPKIIINDGAVGAITYGADLAVPGVVALHEGIRSGDTVAMLTLKGELVAVGVAKMSTEQILQAEKGIAVKTKRVMMERNVYPRLWKKRRSQ